ncbi:MAG: hypothetical protein JO055_13845 [Alphaproteobacteria bacterium]|nr:hypothetical protein [Alphaproteobacteria bacterium]
MRLLRVALAALGIVLSAGAAAQERFDMKVREDLFAGMDGDDAAFARAMTLIDETLAQQPDHAEALVWRGAARLFRSGGLFRKAEFAGAITLSQQGLADMDRAVMLAPDKIGVLVPRATALLPYAKFLPDPIVSRRLTETAIGDFEKVIAISQAIWPQLSVHARGELMGGLAEGLLRIGETERANTLLTRMMGELPDSAYARQAQKRLANPAGRDPLSCLGCH